MDEEELQNKKEGTYITGIPLISSDPVEGQGIGGEIEIISNGNKSDPLFAYTPYRQKVTLEFETTTKNKHSFAIAYDSPYLGDTQWRGRAAMEYVDNPNGLYFGVDKSSMNGLTYHQKNQAAGELINNGHYQDRLDNLRYVRPGNIGEASLVHDYFYNYYRSKTSVLNLSAEKYSTNGKWRYVAGFEFMHIKIQKYDNYAFDGIDPNTGNRVGAVNGKTKLTEDEESGKILGANGTTVGFAQAGIVYDSRDFEIEPSRGAFLELGHEQALRPLGSQFTFGKTVSEARYFFEPLPTYFKKFVVASRLSMNYTSGKSPFMEYSDLWCVEGEREGLGGLRTLRGYKEQRFVAPVIGFGNVETRFRVFETHISDQYMTFNLVPFFDFGRVWNKLNEVNTSNIKYAEGLGLRTGWNQSTVIMLDYAQSIEDKQIFFNLNHIF